MATDFSYNVFYSLRSTWNKLKNNEIKVLAKHWPAFLYEDYQYDPSNREKGLFRGRLIICVSLQACLHHGADAFYYSTDMEGYIHRALHRKISARCHDNSHQER